MWMSEARWAIASSMMVLISRTRVLSDSLTTSVSTATFSVSGALSRKLLTSSDEVARVGTLMRLAADAGGVSAGVLAGVKGLGCTL